MNKIRHLIDGKWYKGEGAECTSLDPSTGHVLGSFSTASSGQVAAAVHAARTAFTDWATLSLKERLSYLERYVENLRAESEEFAQLISQETGKVLWDAKGEVSAMIGKLEHTVRSYHERCAEIEVDVPGSSARCVWRPHGVMSVIGPFNFPGHLPNGHIVPALLSGNTIVFKTSELTPLVGERLVSLMADAGLPSGVVNVIHGGIETGRDLISGDVDGVLFTGSAAAGIAIQTELASTPEKIVALEMGGNNPLIIDRCDDIAAAVYFTILSAYMSSGQRCTCARRLIVIDSEMSDQYIDRLTVAVGKISTGYWTDEKEAFMGPLVSKNAADRVLDYQSSLLAEGAVALSECRRLDELSLLSPGLIDCSGLDDDDVECFGPLLKVYRVGSLDDALDLANDTQYGLAAGLLSDHEDVYRRFFTTVRAGIMNWNRQTTGASSALPFGGMGRSGNHRPSAYTAVDYCSYPVSSLNARKAELPQQQVTGLEDVG